jgi:hypothetical protein
MAKIHSIITCCRECPFRAYDTACGKADNATIVDLSKIASFCPLPDHPANIMSAQEQTIQNLRQQHDYGLPQAVFIQISTCLGLNMSAKTWAMMIPTEKEGQIPFLIDYITEINVREGYEITFFAPGHGEFKLDVPSRPFGHPPKLRRKREFEISGQEKQTDWFTVKLDLPK